LVRRAGPERGMNMVTNSDGDTGRFKALCDWEHDDPEQAPTYQQKRWVNLGGVILATPETATALAAELELEEA
jgi:hypothetical protein